MKRTIGNIDRFAIQFEVTKEIDQFVYGHICYWIGGIQIGDFDSVTILSDVLLFLPTLIKFNGQREHKEFFCMEKEDVYYLLGGEAYLDDEKYEILANEEMWARFNIKLSLDVFSGTIIELIDNEPQSRIVFCNTDEIVKELYLSRGCVDSVLMEFYQVINDFQKS